jgi:threonylcarbamoyladenosine tRNA methylthiotransferase MtaB
MIQHKKVAFYTLGCKLNFSETSTISRIFNDAGFAKVNFEETPDIYVINTCSVTDNADKKCKQIINKALKVNPDAFIVVIGCYAQLKPNEIGKIQGVDLVLGANEKFNILDFIDENFNKKQKSEIYFDNIKKTNEFIPAYSLGDRTRSFFKIQDGCDYFCTFCTIPLARGKSRNASIEKTIIEAEKIALTDVKEVVLTGVNIGDFGQGSNENFLELIKKLDKIEGLERYRISSIEPNLLSNEIIKFVLKESKHFMPHFHIPLQSGSNKLLLKMRRKYLREQFEEKIKYIKELNKNCCIGIDVIVGFPGEKEEDFLETLNFLKLIDFSYLHVFTYSERANTTAVKLEDVVPINIRKERSNILHILSEKKKRQFYEQNCGTEKTVLFEQENESGFIYGFTENYIKVKYPFDEKLINKLKKIKLINIDKDGIFNIEIYDKS